MANHLYDRERHGRDYEEDQRYGRGEEQRRRGTDYGRSNQGNSNQGSNWDFPNRGSNWTEDSYYASNSSYNEPYRSYGNSGGYDYGRIETGNRRDEAYGRGYENRGYENRGSDPYYRNRQYRGFNRGWEDQGEERGMWERAGDEIRSWFGDEEAERRRRQDQIRSEHAGRGPKGYKRSDERIREDVNDRLTGDYYLDAHDIDVSVSDGTVTLSGRVDTRNDKRRAEDLAESVRGVTDVTNQLRVGQDLSMSTTTGTDLTGSTARTRAART